MRKPGSQCQGQRSRQGLAGVRILSGRGGERSPVHSLGPLLFPHLKVLCLNAAPVQRAGDRSWCEHLWGVQSQAGAPMAWLPAVSLRWASSQDQLPGSEHNYEPLQVTPRLPGHHRSLPTNAPKLGRAFPPLQSQGPSPPIPIPPGYCPATVDGRLPFICRYSAPINSPVPATYPPSCKTLSVPSK